MSTPWPRMPEPLPLWHSRQTVKTTGRRSSLRVHGAVRIVTGLAAFDAHRRMLEYERSALIDVALEAGLLVRDRLVHHARALSHAPGGRRSAVRIVAVGALHEAFIHAVLGGHVELRADGGMAGVAHLVLLLCQQIFGRRRVVDGVATGARDIVQGVLGAANVGAVQVARVTFETIVEDGLGRHQGKGVWDGRFAAARFDVRLSRPVATLAPGSLGRFLAGGEALEVRVLEEILKDVGVTNATRIAADEPAWTGRRGRGGRGGLGLRCGLRRRCGRRLRHRGNA